MPPATFASFSQVLTATDTNGLSLASASVRILLASDSVTLATLYTDRTKTTTVTQPISTDALGNFSFYADAGFYKYEVTPSGGSAQPKITIVLSTDPVSGSVEVFNIEDFGALRVDVLSSSPWFDSTSACLQACQAAADFIKQSSPGGHSETISSPGNVTDPSFGAASPVGVVYVPAGNWVGRFELRAPAMVIRGEGPYNSIVHAPPIGGGEAAQISGSGILYGAFDDPIPTALPMVGYINTALSPATCVNAPECVVRDIGYSGALSSTSTNTTGISTRRVIDTHGAIANGTGPSGFEPSGFLMTERLAAWGFACDVAFWFGSSSGSGGFRVKGLDYVGPSAAMMIDGTDGFFADLYLNGGSPVANGTAPNASTPRNFVARLRGSAYHLSNAKLYAGGNASGTFASSNGDGVHALVVEGSHNIVDNVALEDATGYGLLVSATALYTSSSIPSPLRSYSFCANNRMTNLRISGNRYGIGFKGLIGAHYIEATMASQDADYHPRGLVDIYGDQAIGAPTKPSTIKITYANDGWLSAPRTDNATVNSGSATVADTAVVTAANNTDVGRLVTGTGIPAGTYINSAIAGVSFTMSNAATASASSVTISSPVVRLLNGLNEVPQGVNPNTASNVSGTLDWMSISLDNFDNDVYQQTVTPSGGNHADHVSPDAFNGLSYFVTMTVNTTIDAMLDRGACTPGDIVVFVLIQNVSGGNTVTWDSSWVGAPAVSTAASAITVAPFLNIAFNATKPVWQYIGR